MISEIPVNVTVETNANGTAYKFDNGFMICVKRVEERLACTNTWGSLYESTTEMNFGSWPVPFIEKPIVSVTETDGTGDWMGGFFECINDVKKTSAGNSYFVRPTQKTGPVCANIVGFGRWK